jgi:hypothetical protein
VGAGEELLAGEADGGEEDLAGVAVVIRNAIQGWGRIGCRDGCVGGMGVVCGERRHKRSIRLTEGNLEGVVRGAANPAGVDCICKMKAMRDGRKPRVLRLCGDEWPQDEGLTRLGGF